MYFCSTYTQLYSYKHFTVLLLKFKVIFSSHAYVFLYIECLSSVFYIHCIYFYRESMPRAGTGAPQRRRSGLFAGQWGRGLAHDAGDARQLWLALSHFWPTKRSALDASSDFARCPSPRACTRPRACRRGRPAVQRDHCRHNCIKPSQPH